MQVWEAHVRLQTVAETKEEAQSEFESIGLQYDICGGKTDSIFVFPAPPGRRFPPPQVNPSKETHDDGTTS